MLDTDLWRLPPTDLVLADDEVHVWLVSIETSLPIVAYLMQILSPEELSRGNKYRFDKDRTRYLVGRGILRMILGRYQGVDPANLRFVYNEYGKPFLSPATSTETLCFNLSHSGDLIAYAITSQKAVGIDIERIRLDIEFEALAQRFFSARERDALNALPVEYRSTAFYDCWTRKEAYVKAHGKGLSIPLDSFAVSFIPGEPASLIHTNDNPVEAALWEMHELALGIGYAGALVARGTDWKLNHWLWQEGSFA